MTGIPPIPSGPPLEPNDAAHRERLLQAALRSLNLAGSLFFRAELTSPWAYESPEGPEIAAVIQQDNRCIILFHIIAEGSCRILLRDGSAADLVAGDVVIMPYANQHRMTGPEPATPVPISSLFEPPPWTSMPYLKYGGGGAQTRIVCGYLYSDDLPFNPVVGAFPTLVHVRPAGGPLAEWVSASVKYAIDETERGGADASPLMQRLPELLFMECMRHYLRTAPPSASGWIAALGDPVVARALACLHDAPEHDWSLKELAQRSATSRSVLAERFRALLGRAPMAYLAACRQQLAARLLRTTDQSLAEIAGAVGYGSEASFSRAFKRHTGLWPSHFRQKESGRAAAAT